MKKNVFLVVFILFGTVINAQTVDPPQILEEEITIYCGETAIFNAFGSTGFYVWYADSEGTVALGLGDVFETPILTVSTTYFVAASSIDLGEETIYEFTNCGATGRFGPEAYQVDSAYIGTNLENIINVVGEGIQEWVVPYTGTYRISSYGAEGGNFVGYTFDNPGRGARMTGEFELEEGEVLRILVGQKGGQNPNSGGQGGGGGSFVVRVVESSEYQMFDNIYVEPLIVAGGGAGAPNSSANYPVHGRTDTRGPNNVSVGATSSGGGGGGGSFAVDGGGHVTNRGQSFLNGGAGGAGAWAAGGFGGGGSKGSSLTNSAGAGGFDGGDYVNTGGNNVANGGGSFNAGENQDNEEGYKEGDGLVIIAQVFPTPGYLLSELIPVNVIVLHHDVPIPSGPEVVFCGESALLSATGSSTGFVWFFDEEGTEIAGVGQEFTTPPLTQQTTFWLGATGVNYLQTEVTFTNCGATGATGPTQEQLDNEYEGTILAGNVLSENGIQKWTVPVTGTYNIQAYGAAGGGGNASHRGQGGYAEGEIDMVEGQVVYVAVGQAGIHGFGAPVAPEGGFNGGGNGGSAVYLNRHGGSGGGASDVRLGGNSLHDRIIVAAGGAGGSGNGTSIFRSAGGGGGGGGYFGGGGGAGGHIETAMLIGGYGGTQSQGGMGRACADSQNTDGSFGLGGNGGNTVSTNTYSQGSWNNYGGNGGGPEGLNGQSHGTYNHGSGGGGGSSYIGGVQNGSTTEGVNDGQGYITFSFEGDFIIHDCVTELVPITIDVIPLTEPSVTQPSEIYCGETVILTAENSPTGHYAWYLDQEATVFLGTGSTFETSQLSETTDFYVASASSPSLTCISNTVQVTVTVNPNLPEPIAEDVEIYCGEVAVLTAENSPTGYYSWYADQEATIFLANGQSFITPPLGQDATYYVASTSMPLQLPEDSLETTFTGANISNGNMFDVNVLKDIIIYDITVNMNTGTPAGNFEIYYKEGSHIGFEEEASAWTLVASVNDVTNNGSGNPSLLGANLQLQLNENQTYAFYITRTDSESLRHLVGNVVGAVYSQNDELQILEGTGITYPYQINTSPRIWNGIFHYEILPDFLCMSNTVPVNVTVDMELPTPEAENQTVYCGLNAVLIAEGNPGGNYTWFADEQGNTILGYGSVFETPQLTESVSYWVASSSVPEELPEGNLETSFTGANIANGNMFDVNVLQDIILKDIDVNMSTGTATGDFEIYYKEGSHIGFEEEESAWTLLASTQGVTNNGTGNVSPLGLDLQLHLNAGQTYAFYVTRTDSETLRHLVGNNVGDVYSENPELQIMEGTGMTYPYQINTIPRIWNGILHYEILPGFLCISDIVEVQAIVIPVDEPIVSEVSINCGESTELTATASTGFYNWYDSPQATEIIFTGSNFITPDLFGSTVYYLEAFSPGYPECVSQLVSVNVNVGNSPFVSVGDNQTICQNSESLPLGGYIGGSSIGGVWDDGGTGGIFEDINDLNTTWNPPAGFYGEALLTLTTIGMEPCDPANDMLLIIVEPLPLANAGSSHTICANTEITITEASAQYGNIVWQHNGNGTLIDENTITPTYLSVDQDAGNNVELTLNVISENICAPATASDLIVISVITDPEIVSNPNPMNLQTDVSIYTDLSWGISEMADSYDVYFGTTAPGNFQLNQTANSVVLWELEYLQEYFWRIDAVNQCATTQGETWFFVTEDFVSYINDDNNINDIVINLVNKELIVSIPEKEMLKNVKIYNALGAKLKFARTERVHMSEFAAGLYIVVVETDRRVITERLVLSD